MSTAAVSSQSIFQELQSFYQSRQTDLQQLGSALQNGDLNGAQQAFQSLAVLGDGGPFANSEPFSKSNKADAFNAVGEAIAAGNLAGAQSAFATLTGNQNGSTNPATAEAAVVSLASAQPGGATASDAASSIYRQLQTYRQQRTADLAQLGQDLQAGNLSAAQQDFNTLTALGQTGPNKNGQTFSRADRNQDFQAIGQALQSGDLAGAQSAFATLETSLTQRHQAQTAVSAYNNVAAEIVINFGGASGNVTSTTSAPAVAQSSSTPANPIPELVINLGSSPISNTNAPEIVVNVGQGNNSLSGSAATPELTINLEGAPGTSVSTGSNIPEVLINLGTTNSTSPAERVQINLGNSGATVSIGPEQPQNEQPQNNTRANEVSINPNQQGASGYELILNLLNSTTANSPHGASSTGLSVSA